MPSYAQNIRTVLFIKVKLGQEDAWKAAAKDYVAVVKKAGSKTALYMWDSETGPAQHALVWYSTKWKEKDEQEPALKAVEADLTQVMSRLAPVTESLEYWIDEMQPDLRITSADMPAMVRVSRTRVISGKMDEVKALFHEQIFPAIKKSGATSYGVAYARYGTPSNEIHTYMGLKGWADLDGPVGSEKGMTPEEYKTFQAKVTPLIESTEWSIWRYNAELSYIAAAK